MESSVTFGDLRRDPDEVARGLVAWVRGDPAEAAVQTLGASARELHSSRYTLWVWAGRTTAGEPAWALPISTPSVIAFAPKGPAAMLLRCLETAVYMEAEPTAVRLEDWRGYACLVLPGIAEDLAAAIVEDAHPPPARARLATLPPEVTLGGPTIPLPGNGGAHPTGPVAQLAHELSVHPVRVALTLASHGIPPSSLPGDSSEFLGPLREWGCAGDRAPAPTPRPSLAIADDPCPRRRHARTVLQRLLRMGKVGAGYHTELSNFARGAAAHERHQAIGVAEALLRAGLLGEKPSVGQRHIYLNVKALPEIHALIDRGETHDPQLTAAWTAPAPGEVPVTAPAP